MQRKHNNFESDLVTLEAQRDPDEYARKRFEALMKHNPKNDEILVPIQYLSGKIELVKVRKRFDADWW
ncbi:hypothetical protein DPMN_109507 [Dreissena polymorpha]|uniref:Uncharacterized protein n=1 Tax=Dreissena polymorpha TaxID=45954 RepID=A0A9D4KAE0_DREPO|nr:hypothetical protein DPMN_109507 [Dreissena polymorpha]